MILFTQPKFYPPLGFYMDYSDVNVCLDFPAENCFHVLYIDLFRQFTEIYH